MAIHLSTARRSHVLAHVTFAAVALLALQPLHAGYVAPDPAYAAPATYYNLATGTGTTLRTNLHNIISNMTSINYGDARYALDDIDRDPNNANNVILVYTDNSVSGTWDGGITWNREHLWPQSLLGVSVTNTYKGPASDLFELRPAGSSTNSSRGNKGYGSATTTGGTSATTTSFFPGDADKGDVARAMFYMATRYYTGSTTLSSTNLALVNGTSLSTYQMGDLQALLHWNYQDGVDNFERRANQVIYAGWNNQSSGATQAQRNRNPYIDHPEYVWAVFGDSLNDSQISIATANVTATGGSSLTVSLGRVMKNGVIGTSAVTLNKSGADPTTFNIVASGNAVTVASGTSLLVGVGQPMDYGTQTRTLTVGLNASTATTGAKTGTITVTNTDLTTAGAGKGSNDGIDTVSIAASVLQQRVVTPSTPTLNLGTLIVGATVNSGFTLATVGDDNSNTRVNVAGSSATDANGLHIAGSTSLFNTDTSTGTRSVTGSFSTAGAKSGSLGLTISSAENNGAGLTGEGVYAPLNVSYNATVLAHSNASFSPTVDSDTLTLDFGTLALHSGTSLLNFSLINLVTLANYTAGLDLLSYSLTGDSEFSSTLTALQNLTAGSTRGFQVYFDTSIAGHFSAIYTINVADQQTLPGAANGTALTLNLTGTVSAVPEPASLTLLLTGSFGLLTRRRRMN